MWRVGARCVLSQQSPRQDLIEATAQTRSSEPLLSLWLPSSVVPGLRSELQHVAAGPGGQERQGVAQVSPRLDVVELTAGDEAGGDGIPLSAEQRVATKVGKLLLKRVWGAEASEAEDLVREVKTLARPEQ